MSTQANPIPDWAVNAARQAYDDSPIKVIGGLESGALIQHFARAINDAVMAERERWSPASIYFERYCQDEADAAEECISKQQHRDAKAFAAVVRGEG